MRQRTAAVWTAVALAGSLVAAGAPAAYAADRTAVPGTHPSWATAANKAGAVDPAQKLSFRVYLKLRDQAGAEAAAQAVSSPDNARFRKYLTPAQVRDTYAPTNASVGAVKSWLASAGFKVTGVPANNQYVQVSGTVDQAQRAFGVELAKYAYHGNTLRAANHDVSVPASVGSIVSGVVGLDQSLNLLKPTHRGASDEVAARPGAKALAKPTVVPPPDGFRNAPPCSQFWAQKVDRTDPPLGGGFPNPTPYAPCGYTPPQLRSAYGLEPFTSIGLDGRGTTVAIIDAFGSPTILADAQEYARRNDPRHPLRASQFKEMVEPPTPGQEAPDVCDAAGWYGEETLDVEAVHGMAPGANILYMGSADCQDLTIDATLNKVVSENLAQIVSNSYGSAGEDIDPAEVAAFQTIAVQAVLEGIGVYFSSGDSGDEAADLGTPSPDFSASSPWVTAVGGTSLGVGRDGHTVLETGWETGRTELVNGVFTPPAPGSFLYGSGGGTSRLFSEPFYQVGVVPDALAKQNQTGNARGRVVPDISMVGDPNTGMLIGQTQTFPEGVQYGQFRIGGTSLSCPLFAGMMAVADQLARARHGFINPVLYRRATRTAAVKDVKHVNNAVIRVDFVNGLDAADGLRVTGRTFDFGGLTIHTTPGYDNVTGLGTPNGIPFLLLI
jgi:subtilase family serine protease